MPRSSSSRRHRVISIVATLGLMAGLLALSTSTASAVGPLTLTPASAEIAPGGSVTVQVKNTDPKKSTSALSSSVALSPSNAPFAVTNNCLGVALGRNKTCTVTIAYTSTTAPAEAQTATLSVQSKKPGVVSLVTGVYTVAAAPTGCAKNTAAGSAPSNDLQAVINAATAGDTIEITGTCTGNFSIGASVTLTGVEGTQPTLNGGGTGRVLFVSSGSVVLNGLTITGGVSTTGGGIYNEGALTLNDSIVTGNTSSGEAGGIFNIESGSLTLNQSSVTGNSAAKTGGIRAGCSNNLVVLNDSTVSDNTAASFSGGGIDICNATVVLRDSSVTGNSSVTKGGGVYMIGGNLQLRASSSVTGNTAPAGGGIRLDFGGSVQACDGAGADPWTGAISPNTPDDPPAVTLITCT